MPKTIALQSMNQSLIDLLKAQGYKVIDMYEAHRQRTSVDAYLYTTYHPDAFTSYSSLAQPADIILGDTTETTPMPSTVMLNITNLDPEQVLMKLERRLQEKHWET